MNDDAMFFPMPNLAGMVMAGGGGGGEAAEEAAPVEEKTHFDLKLVTFDAKAKIKIIKEVRAATKLGLKEVRARTWRHVHLGMCWRWWCSVADASACDSRACAGQGPGGERACSVVEGRVQGRRRAAEGQARGVGRHHGAGVEGLWLWPTLDVRMHACVFAKHCELRCCACCS